MNIFELGDLIIAEDYRVGKIEEIHEDSIGFIYEVKILFSLNRAWDVDEIKTIRGYDIISLTNQRDWKKDLVNECFRER